ncbi:MAG TPA: nodulation protein NfeD [Woeseiaceae bacterium]|nr:nodulation protein NfeD [Woeseiaceae bacterium]
MLRRSRAALAALFALAAGPAGAEGLVLQLELDGPLGVGNAEYIINGIEQAEERNASLVIIRMDTPGGLVNPMRDIVKAILGSSVPVATYVAPGGARADSAGTYILLASHIAAMAPTTHLGAATPVSLGGDPPDSPSPFEPRPDEPPKGESPGDEGEAAPGNSDEEQHEAEPPRPDSAMERKILNDAVAYIRALAEAHGRNADWAEKAVRDAATLTAEAALQENVIDVIAASREELLAKIDGREVTVDNEQVTVATGGAMTVEEVEPGWRTKFLTTISNPEIAVLLWGLGFTALILEFFHPGAMVPGVVGVICLLLGAYALQIIPVNYAGLALLLLGFALIIAEAFVPSFGILGLGGIAAFCFGAIMMFDSGIPGFGISIVFVVTFAVLTGAALLLILGYIMKLRRRGAVTGEGSIVGGIGTAMEDFTVEGRVWLEGEAWHAVSDAPVRKDEEVLVRRLEGLTLYVEPTGRRDRSEAQFQT